MINKKNCTGKVDNGKIKNEFSCSADTICTDAGSENCPCVLAESGNCITCSLLRGKNVCECSWTGVCILNHLMHNGGNKADTRREISCTIENIHMLRDDFAIITFHVPLYTAITCSFPGTYIFLRPAGSPAYYDTPVSILSSDIANSSLTVGIRIISAKTKALAFGKARTAGPMYGPAVNPAGGAAAPGRLLMRGPFRNGITGLPSAQSGADILIIARGAGLCPGLFAIQNMYHNNNVGIIIEDCDFEHDLFNLWCEMPGGCFRCGASEEFRSEFRNIDRLISELRNSGNHSSINDFSRYDKIIVLGCSSFTEKTAKALKPFAGNAQICTSNDMTACCGEGICGACGKIMTGNGPVPRCKLL